jgi:hypothetical protein
MPHKAIVAVARATRFSFGEKKKILTQFLLGDLIGAPPIKLGELAHGRDVAALRSCGEPPQLHILQHPFSQTGHDDLLSREVAASRREIVFVLSIESMKKCV